jgi:hypothetical protein
LTGVYVHIQRCQNPCRCDPRLRASHELSAQTFYLHRCNGMRRSLVNDFSEGFDASNQACSASCSPSAPQTSIAMVDALSYDTVWGGAAARTYVSPTAWPLCNNDLTAAVCVYAHANNYHSTIYFRHGGRGSVVGSQVRHTIFSL